MDFFLYLCGENVLAKPNHFYSYANTHLTLAIRMPDDTGVVCYAGQGTIA